MFFLIVVAVLLHAATPPWHALDDVLTTLSVACAAVSLFVVATMGDGVAR